MKLNKNYLILSAIIFLHLIFVAISMNQPFHGDEVVLVEAAKAVIKTGLPIIDFGINNPDFSVLVHVPFHIYMLSGFMYLFGQSVYAIKSLSAIFNLLTIILVYFITKEILNKNKSRENWALFAAFIYALNPLTIQSSILVDIDAGILNFGMYLFLYLFIKNKSFYYLFPSLLFVFFSKEVGAPFLFLSIMLFYLATFNWKKIPKMIALFLLGGIVWLGTWKIFASITELNFMEPLLFNFGMIFNLFSGGGNSCFELFALLTRVWGFKNFFYFAVPFFVILFLVFSFIFYYKILKNKKILKIKEIQNILLFNILALLVFFVYLFTGGSAWGFPKYHIIAVPSMSIFIVYILSKSNIIQYLKKIFNEKKEIFIILGILLILYFLFFIKDPLMPEFDSTRHNADMADSFFLILKSFVLYVIIPFLICFFILSVKKIKMKIWICLIYLSLFMFFYLNILHAVVGYSTYSKYGDIGIPEVITYFEEKNIPAKQIATHSHMGSYLGMSDYYEISFVYEDSEIFKREIVDNENIEYIVIWQRDINRIGENMNYFGLEEKIGTYYIFKKT